MLDDAMKLRLRQKYDALDIDGSGLLEQNEVETLIGQLMRDVPLSPAMKRNVMDSMDTDGSGEVDFEEFCAWSRTAMQMHAAAVAERQTSGGEQRLTRTLSDLSEDFMNRSQDFTLSNRAVISASRKELARQMSYTGLLNRTRNELRLVQGNIQTGSVLKHGVLGKELDNLLSEAKINMDGVSLTKAIDAAPCLGWIRAIIQTTAIVRLMQLVLALGGFTMTANCLARALCDNAVTKQSGGLVALFATIGCAGFFICLLVTFEMLKRALKIKDIDPSSSKNSSVENAADHRCCCCQRQRGMQRVKQYDPSYGILSINGSSDNGDRGDGGGSSSSAGGDDADDELSAALAAALSAVDTVMGLDESHEVEGQNLRRETDEEADQMEGQGQMDPRFIGCTLHVRNLGKELENEAALKAVFSRYGRVVQATVRRRINDRDEVTSWALVTMAEATITQVILAEHISTPATVLKVTAFNEATAATSTGAMRNAWLNAVSKACGVSHWRHALRRVEISRQLSAHFAEREQLDVFSRLTPPGFLISESCVRSMYLWNTVFAVLFLLPILLFIAAVGVSAASLLSTDSFVPTEQTLIDSEWFDGLIVPVVCLASPQQMKVLMYCLLVLFVPAGVVAVVVMWAVNVATILCTELVMEAIDQFQQILDAGGSVLFSNSEWDSRMEAVALHLGREKLKAVSSISLILMPQFCGCILLGLSALPIATATQFWTIPFWTLVLFLPFFNLLRPAAVSTSCGGCNY